MVTFELNQQADWTALDNFLLFGNDPDGDQLTFSSDDFDIPGLNFENGNGRIQGVPNVPGEFSFNIIGTDPEGASDTTVITVNINAPNTPPNLPGQPIEIVMNQFQQTNINILEFLPNPLDNENDQVTLTIDTENVPQNLIPDGQRVFESIPPDVRFENNSFVGVPEEDGIFVMMLVANDGNGGESRQAIEITVVPQPEIQAGFGVYPIIITVAVGDEINLNFCDEDQFPFIKIMDAREKGPYSVDLIYIRHGNVFNAIPGLVVDAEQCTISGTVEGGAVDQTGNMRYQWLLSVRWRASDDIIGQISPSGIFGIRSAEDKDLNPPQLPNEINFTYRVGDEVNVLWEDVLD